MSRIPNLSTLHVTADGPLRRITLARPAQRNAFNALAIADLQTAFIAMAADAQARCVVLDGEGEAFCAGADLHYMREVADFGSEANIADALQLAAMLAAVRDCPKPVIARVHGAAFGGGAGLVAAADIAVAAASTRFAFSEVRLGLVPAVISPFVVSRIGLSAARELFLTGETFGAEQARAIGLVRHVAADGDLDAAVADRVEAILTGGPEAQTAVKALLARLARDDGDVTAYTAQAIAARRSSAEGREGMASFLERRPPSWRAVTGDSPTGDAG